MFAHMETTLARGGPFPDMSTLLDILALETGEPLWVA
jgi:hypothetical protein